MEAAADLYFDKYGNVNVLDLDWREIKFYNKNMRRHIQGFHLNKLLHGLFILFGYKTPRGSDLPGGVLCWEEIVEPVYVSLVMICSAECVLARVSFVLDLWRRCKETYVGNIAYGALSFLLLWVSRFNVYIADELLIYIKGGVNSLDRLLGGSCCTDESFQDALVEDCHKKCIARLSELQEVVQKVCSDRSAIASGIYRVLKRLDNETTSDGQVKQSPYYNVKDHSNVLFPEDTAAIEGSWTGFEQAQLEEQRRLELNQLASAPKLQLDLFGADTFLDSEDEDSLNSDHKMDASTYSLRPITRVPPGISLLQNPTELKLEAIDSLELARQWTLIDHALFCSIPLYSLLGNGDRSDSYTAPRFRQLKVGQVRRFIDRFNATSMWVTRTILQCNTPHEKAQIISKFIQVMSHLADLYNFNGVMAVLTALQQGCIARLKISFDLVSRSEKAKLEKLQVLMAGNKNYQAYREEIGKLSLFFAFENNDNDASIELAWKRSNVDHATDKALDTYSYNHSSGDRFYSDDRVEGIVPHIGAHLAELTAITEGNPSFIPENPHLINMNKYSLYSNTLTTLRKMQRLKYNLTSVRMIVAALNHQIKLHSKLSLSESSEYSKMLFKMSEETESNTMITRYQSGDTSMVGSSIEHNQSNIDARRSPSPVVPPPPSDGHGHSSIHSTPSNTAHKKLPGSPTLSRKDSFSAQKKFRKSDAYDRIMKSTQNLEIAVSSQNLHENNDSDDSGQSEKNHSMKKSKAKSKLKAMVRAVIFTTKLKNNSV